MPLLSGFEDGVKPVSQRADAGRCRLCSEPGEPPFRKRRIRRGCRRLFASDRAEIRFRRRALKSRQRAETARQGRGSNRGLSTGDFDQAWFRPRPSQSGARLAAQRWFRRRLARVWMALARRHTGSQASQIPPAAMDRRGF